LLMLGYPNTIFLDALYVVLSSPRIHPQVEILGIGISFFYIFDPCTLFFSSPLNEGKANNSPFQTRSKLKLIRG
jgi:hypothetical protein